MQIRKQALILHRFTGVIVGLLLVVIGLSGSTLVFWQELDHSRNIALMEMVPQENMAAPPVGYSPPLGERSAD